jgi:hypothetical protein
MHQHTEIAPTEYRLGRKTNFWIAFTPSDTGTGTAQTWQFQVSARNRGGAKTLGVLLETTPVQPLATVTLRGESYPLPICWHEMRRGGVLCLGGERRTGLDGSRVEWEMRWMPAHDLPGAYRVEMRVRAEPRREGHLHVFLNAALHAPDLWLMPSAALHGHGAALAWSAYSKLALSLVTIDGEAGTWDEERDGFLASWRQISLGGGRLIRFGLRFGMASTARTARASLVSQYVSLASPGLNLLDSTPCLDALPAVTAITDPTALHLRGVERLYLKPPTLEQEPETFYAGFPHYPADALVGLSDWARFRPSDNLNRLVRFGANGLAADFQVMGRQGESEPNKGAFWDRLTPDGPTDYAGGQTHGLAANARLARAFFRLHSAGGDPLLRQSALNICQWLILKQNERGYFDGARVWATRGLAGDGKFIPQECALDGAEAIRPLVLAFRATANEVFVKAAWKIADYLLAERIPDFDAAVPTDVASVLCGLMALDAEAPNARLRAGISDWGAWLRSLPLSAESPGLNADGLHSGLYECAQAGFLLHALTTDAAYLRYGLAALNAIPLHSRARSPHAMEARTSALLSLACLMPDAHADFEALQVSLGWRVFAPDPATSQFLRVTAADGSPVDFLPLVCRLNDQLLIIALAPPDVPALTIHKNGRRPLVRDLLTDTRDTDAPLHSIAGESWGRVGLFTVDP